MLYGQAIGELEKVLEVGRMHVNVLYTFRSVSRAIPMVSGSGDPNKNALHMNTFKVRFSLGDSAYGRAHIRAFLWTIRGIDRRLIHVHAVADEGWRPRENYHMLCIADVSCTYHGYHRFCGQRWRS